MIFIKFTFAEHILHAILLPCIRIRSGCDCEICCGIIAAVVHRHSFARLEEVRVARIAVTIFHCDTSTPVSTLDISKTFECYTYFISCYFKGNNVHTELLRRTLGRNGIKIILIGAFFEKCIYLAPVPFTAIKKFFLTFQIVALVLKIKCSQTLSIMSERILYICTRKTFDLMIRIFIDLALLHKIFHKTAAVALKTIGVLCQILQEKPCGIIVTSENGRKAKIFAVCFKIVSYTRNIFPLLVVVRVKELLTEPVAYRFPQCADILVIIPTDLMCCNNVSELMRQYP